MRSVSYFLWMVLLALAFASTGMAGRYPLRMRHGHLAHHHSHIEESADREADHFGLGLSVVCIPTAATTIEEHEGRQRCAYDHPRGFRAVGVAYNLDDDVETRKSELSTLFLDYDKVYKGEQCLWDIQITALLTLDAKRALNKVTESVEGLEDLCCDVQAVFADIQHSIGPKKSVTSEDLKGFVEKATVGEWKSAARELEETDWCYENKKRCEAHIKTLKSGCNGLLSYEN
ncbi:unnamed protein product [Calypogeia fissa]